MTGLGLLTNQKTMGIDGLPGTGSTNTILFNLSA